MEYGSVLPKDFTLPSSAFWLLKDLGTANPFALVNLRPGDRVMDCGAFIGTFAAACLEQDASRAFCYEAAPKNATLLRENVGRYDNKALVREAALVPGYDPVVTLTMSGFSGANSILPSENRKKVITVPAVCFRDELRTHNPNVLKLDVEGAEYDLLDSLHLGDLASVRVAFVEFHPIDKRDERIACIRNSFEREGFKVLSDRRRAFVVEHPDR